MYKHTKVRIKIIRYSEYDFEDILYVIVNRNGEKNSMKKVTHLYKGSSFIVFQYSFDIYFSPLFCDPTQWRHRDRRRTFFDEDSSIDHLCFLYWTKSSGTENLLDIYRPLDSNMTSPITPWNVFRQYLKICGRIRTSGRNFVRGSLYHYTRQRYILL